MNYNPRMSFSEDVRNARERFPSARSGVRDSLKKHGIHNDIDGVDRSVVSAGLSKGHGQRGRTEMKADGGKLTLGVMFAIVGAALGGVGIAAMGGAIGVPLALIGALVGLVVGNEADTEGYTSTFIVA